MSNPITLVKVRHAQQGEFVGCLQDETVERLVVDLEGSALTALLEAEDPCAAVEASRSGNTLPRSAVELLPPIDAQEVWAAGVTYTRSKSARMEESEAAASCYDRVYVADRPELFLKATPHRVVGSGQPIRIREDATWNVPEPELTLVLSRTGRLVGYTVGNDMSSRDIEGDNPLYLPQAKVYDACCGLGPGIVLADSVEGATQWPVDLEILRDGMAVFTGQTDIGQMARTFQDLIGWLYRDNSFPHGAYLMTGTGIVPDSDFTLHPGDEVRITIGPLGTLVNTVVQGGR